MILTGHSTISSTLNNLEENTPYTITVQTDSSGTLSVNSDLVSVTTWTDVSVAEKLCKAMALLLSQKHFKFTAFGILVAIQYMRYCLTFILPTVASTV